MEKLYLPTKIKVGYNKREDTYSKKLAYVIYYDHKGVLRKETSWENWRDKKIAADEFENTPMSGFVLNRPVGGVKESYGWNTRNSYIRVYDPRGFEIEISLDNLLFILEVCNSYTGKGLEGEFVYGWAGKDLVLLPVNTVDYQESLVNTDLKSSDIKFKDLVVGKTYQSKDGDKLIYLGSDNVATPHHKSKYYKQYGWTYSTVWESYYDSSYTKYHGLLKKELYGNAYFCVISKQHMFYDIEKNQFEFLTSNKSLSKVYDEEIYPELGDLYDELRDSDYSLNYLSKVELKTFNIIDDQLYSMLRSSHSEGYKFDYFDFVYEKIDENNYYQCAIEVLPVYRSKQSSPWYNDSKYPTDDYQNVKIVRKRVVGFNDNNILVYRNVTKKEVQEKILTNTNRNLLMKHLEKGYVMLELHKKTNKFFIKNG